MNPLFDLIKPTDANRGAIIPPESNNRVTGTIQRGVVAKTFAEQGR